MIRFTIKITNYHWSCGDGCCSDSGYKLSVHDNQENKCIIDDSEWEYNHDEEERESEGIRAIEEILGRSPLIGADYEVENEYEDSDSDSFMD